MTPRPDLTPAQAVGAIAEGCAVLAGRGLRAFVCLPAEQRGRILASVGGLVRSLAAAAPEVMAALVAPEERPAERPKLVRLRFADVIARPALHECRDRHGALRT